MSEEESKSFEYKECTLYFKKQLQVLLITFIYHIF